MRYVPLLLSLALASPGCAHPAAAASGGSRLEVMTYNLWAWRKPSDASVELMALEDPDVIVAQEVTGPWKRRLLADFGESHPHHRIRASGAYGYAVFSKYPLGSADYLAVDGAPTYAQCVQVKLPNQAIRLCNLHLKSPIGSFQRGAETSKGLEANEAMRHRQWQDLHAWLIRVAPDELHIIAGDTNAPGFDDLNDVMAEHYVDAHAAVTMWTDSTFPNQPLPKSSMGSWLPAIPFVRLDYVWVSPSIGVHRAEVLDGGDSDHLPVVVELSLPARAVARPAEPGAPARQAEQQHDVGRSGLGQ